MVWCGIFEYFEIGVMICFYGIFIVDDVVLYGFLMGVMFEGLIVIGYDVGIVYFGFGCCDVFMFLGLSFVLIGEVVECLESCF